MAESLVPYHDHRRFSPAAPDVLAELADLRRRSEALDQDDYVRYVDLLAQVYEAFLCDGRSQAGT